MLKSVIGDVWIEINRRQRVYRRRFHQSRLRWAWSMYETFNVNRFLSFAQVEYIYLQLFTHSDKTPSLSRVFMKWNWQFFREIQGPSMITCNRIRSWTLVGSVHGLRCVRLQNYSFYVFGWFEVWLMICLFKHVANSDRCRITAIFK